MENFKLIDKVGYVTFDSMDEFERDAPAMYNKRNAMLANHAVYQLNMTSYPDDWFGVSGWKALDAMQKIQRGWPEMLVKLRSMLDKLPRDIEVAHSVVETRRRKRQRSDHGDTLDMHRVWGGQLDTAWERPMRVPRLNVSQRHASVFINLGARASEGEDLLWRAAAAMLICDILQRAGRSVEIWCGSVGVEVCEFGGPSKVICAMRVKEYTQPLNEEILAAMLTAGFHRTYGFLMRMCCPYSVSYGMGLSVNGGLPITLQERQEAGELVVDLNRCNTKNAAIAEFEKVRAQLARKEVA